MISLMLRKLFTCRFQERRCVGNWGGCRCGKGKGTTGRALGLAAFGALPLLPLVRKRQGRGSKSEARADDLARQAQQQAQQTAAQQVQQSQGLSAEELARSQALADFERQQAQTEQGRVEQQFAPTSAQDAQLQALLQRSSLTPEQLFSQISPDASALQQRITQQIGQTPDQLFRGISPLAGQYADITQQQLGAPPQITEADTLTPALQLAQQQQAGYFNRRGLLGSGLEAEGQTRAAQELAIREAQFRTNLAQVNQQLRRQAQQQAAGLIGTEQGLGADAISRAADLAQTQYGLSQEARNQYQNYLQALQDQRLQGTRLGEDVLQRGQARGFEAAESGLGRGFQAREGGLERGFSATETGAQRQAGFNELGFNALQNRMEQARQRDAAIAQALGSAAIGGVAGGLGFIPGIAGMGAAGGTFLGGFGRGALQSALGVGAFSPFAGLNQLFSQQQPPQSPVGQLLEFSRNPPNLPPINEGPGLDIRNTLPFTRRIRVGDPRFLNG